MNEIAFWKMSGAGNDFVVVREGDVLRESEAPWVRRICARRHGVGADGVLFVGAAGDGRIGLRFRNPDSSEAFCGNGTRCAAMFARQQGMVGDEMILETTVGAVPASIRGDRVWLELPAPRDLGARTLDPGDGPLNGRVVDAGCPHYVVVVEDPALAPLERWGPALRRDPSFGAAGANIDLVGRAGDPRVLRTWERGVEGETLACGSGAIAAAVAAWREDGERRRSLLPPGGIPLEVELTGTDGRIEGVVLVGDARVVFEGKIGAGAG